MDELDPSWPDLNFEDELREGLRPRPTPPGFADRVMRRVDGPVSKPSLFQLPALRWALAAALMVAVAMSGYREHQRRLAGERARKQVLLALRITGSTLRAVHNKVVSGDEAGPGD